MSTNESQPKPGFRRTANDLLGIPEGTEPKFRNFGDELGQVMNDYHERRQQEEVRARQMRLVHAAEQLEEFKTIKVENAIATAGKPVLRLIEQFVIADLNMPMPIEQASGAVVSEVERPDDRLYMTINEIREMINQENIETSIYNADTVQDHPHISDDPVTYARKNNIRINY